MSDISLSVDLIGRLRDIVGPEHALTDPAEQLPYLREWRDKYEGRAAVVLRPGTTHVMLTGLKQPLKEGETFPLTLDFAKAGKQDVQVKVAKAGAMDIPGMGAAGAMT